MHWSYCSLALKPSICGLSFVSLWHMRGGGGFVWVITNKLMRWCLGNNSLNTLRLRDKWLPFGRWRFQVLFSCDQAALWMVFSVCLSVRLSVCLSVCLSHLFDYVPIIVSSWNFQELLPMTKVTSMQKVKVRGQRSRSQRSTPNLTVSGL